MNRNKISNEVWKHFQRLERKPGTHYYYACCKFCDEDGLTFVLKRTSIIVASFLGADYFAFSDTLFFLLPPYLDLDRFFSVFTVLISIMIHVVYIAVIDAVTRWISIIQDRFQIVRLDELHRQ